MIALQENNHVKSINAALFRVFLTADRMLNREFFFWKMPMKIMVLRKNHRHNVLLLLLCAESKYVYMHKFVEHLQTCL